MVFFLSHLISQNIFRNFESDFHFSGLNIRKCQWAGTSTNPNCFSPRTELGVKHTRHTVPITPSIICASRSGNISLEQMPQSLSPALTPAVTALEGVSNSPCSPLSSLFFSLPPDLIFLFKLPSCSETYWFHRGCWVESKLSGWPSQTPTVWSPLLCQHSTPLSAFLSFYPQPHHVSFVPRIPQAQAAPRPLFQWFPLPSAFFLHTCLSKSSKTSNSIASKKHSGGFSTLPGRGPSLPASHLTIYCINTLWSGLFRNVYLPYHTLGLWRTLFAFLIPPSTGAERQWIWTEGGEETDAYPAR